MPLKLFIAMPEGHFLEEKEGEQLHPSTPLLVIEGYARVSSAEALKEKLQQIGLIELLNADSGVTRIGEEPLPLDDEGKEDILHYAGQKQLLDEIFQPDHFYASSIKEER